MFHTAIVGRESSVNRHLQHVVEYENMEFRQVHVFDHVDPFFAALDEVRPDLVIADLHSLGVDDLQFVLEIRKRGHSTEIVAISSHRHFMSIKQALQAGMADYLFKPIETDDVVNMLRGIADKIIRKKRDLHERSEWITFCKMKVGRLAKQMWVLNEAGVKEELKELHDQLLHNHSDPAQVCEMYLHFLSLLKAEIIELDHQSIPLENMFGFQMIPPVHSMPGHSESLLMRMMDEVRKKRNWGSHKNMMNALKLIKMEYVNESFSLKETAERIGMSPTYFSKAFKEELGLSYSQYIAKLRMERAIELLSDPVKKVYEVALAVGYSEYAHFAKVFKKYYGFSPSDYRQQLSEPVQHG